MYLWKGKDMKIFLTGDNHIGLKYASHPQSAILCERRISAFQGMVDSANKENCDIFVIAGDLFENTYSIAKKDIKTLLEILSHFRGNVVVLPGNHDYYDADVKVWQYFKEVMKTYDNITLITDYRKYKIDCIDQSVILYPAHCTSLHSAPMENNLNWIKAESFFDSSAFHIGIAHGAVEGETIDNEGEYFFMKRSELENIPVDIWLIGHTHVPFPRNLIEKDYIVMDGETYLCADINFATSVPNDYTRFYTNFPSATYDQSKYRDYTFVSDKDFSVGAICIEARPFYAVPNQTIKFRLKLYINGVRYI
jgi:DNA repair exonuclease SbcCD nuclease subunit